MNCPKCNNPLAPNAEFCSNCYTNLSNMQNSINNSLNSQQMANYQQQINPQPLRNQNYNYLNNNVNNGQMQNITNINAKKINPFIIVIPIVIIVIGVICYFTLFNKGDPIGNNPNSNLVL